MINIIKFNKFQFFRQLCTFNSWQNIKQTLRILLFTSITLIGQAYGDVFKCDVLSEKPCEVIKGVSTTDVAIDKLTNKFGPMLRVVQYSIIQETGQNIVNIEIREKQNVRSFLVADGSAEQCNALLENIRAKMKLKARNEDLTESANWIRIGVTPDGRTDYVDSNTIRKDDSGLVRLWVKQEYASPHRGPKNIIFSKVIVSIALNCKQLTTSPTALAYYDTHNNLLLQSSQQRFNWNFTESQPESLQSVLLRHHCN